MTNSDEPIRTGVPTGDVADPNAATRPIGDPGRDSGASRASGDTRAYEVPGSNDSSGPMTRGYDQMQPYRAAMPPASASAQPYWDESSQYGQANGSDQVVVRTMTEYRGPSWGQVPPPGSAYIPFGESSTGSTRARDRKWFWPLVGTGVGLVVLFGGGVGGYAIGHSIGSGSSQSTTTGGIGTQGGTGTQGGFGTQGGTGTQGGFGGFGGQGGTGTGNGTGTGTGTGTGGTGTGSGTGTGTGTGTGGTGTGSSGSTSSSAGTSS